LESEFAHSSLRAGFLEFSRGFAALLGLSSSGGVSVLAISCRRDLAAVLDAEPKGLMIEHELLKI
jgi:hypothetical protein